MGGHALLPHLSNHLHNVDSSVAIVACFEGIDLLKLLDLGVLGLELSGSLIPLLIELGKPALFP